MNIDIILIRLQNLKNTDLMSAAIVFGAAKPTESAPKQIRPNGSERRHQHVKAKVEFLAADQERRFNVL
jgi:hypothetical protein